MNLTWKNLFAVVLCFVGLIACRVVIAAESLEVKVTYLGREENLSLPLSLVDLPVEDNGIQGSLLGLNDNQTTGAFLNQQYTFEPVLVGLDEDIVAVFRSQVDKGDRLFIVDLDTDDLLAIANLFPDVLLFSVRSKDNSLRNESCRSNVFHVAPSRAMLTDALAQYLSWKRWSRFVLVTGRHKPDALYAESVLRSGQRYGLKVVQQKDWTSIPGARRTDSGHHSLQQEVPAFSKFKKHDVVIVADESDEFGEYFTYRTSDPRPVAGTQGLLSTSWHRTQEQWGATQIQRRFMKLAGRMMTQRDYAAWLAMRSLGEAVTNTNTNNAASIRTFLLSDQFKLAGFKGVPLTFRDWNGQLRQPVLIVGPRMLVSVSPQAGFIHERSVLDTLGYDKPESACSGF